MSLLKQPLTLILEAIAIPVLSIAQVILQKIETWRQFHQQDYAQL